MTSSPTVITIGADQHVHQLYFANANWSDSDLTTWGKGPQVAVGSSLSSFADSFGEHVFYIGADQHVRQLYFANANWSDQDLTTWGKGPQVATGSSLSSFADSFGEHALYIGADQHVHQLYFANANWSDSDLTTWGKGPQVATGSSLSSFADSFGEHVFYVGNDQHVHQLWFNTATWADQDLTTATGGPLAVPASGITSFAISDGEHVFYVGDDGHAHQLYYDKRSWIDRDLISNFKRVPGFVPSVSGLHFVNSWPSGTTYPVVTLPIVGTVISGDASNGLCGGFVLTALDCFLHSPRLSPPTTQSAPASGTPLFNYLVQRLLDSFLAIPPDPAEINDAGKCIAWIQTSGHDVEFSFYGWGLARRMVQTEWPRIQADIDSGRPSPLFIVAAPQCAVADFNCLSTSLHHCHQVLAYAYLLDNQNNLTLWVYDCNDPFNDNSTISLNISDPGHTIQINAPSIIAALGGGITIRGIFRTDYVLKDPTAIAV